MERTYWARAARSRRRSGGEGDCAGGNPAPFRVAGAWLDDGGTTHFTAASRLPIFREACFGAVYPKLHHAGTRNEVALDSIRNGWAQEWRAAGRYIVGWGWLEGDPAQEARLAVELCHECDVDAYVANAEIAYEGEAGYTKSATFCNEFRRLAPNAPLALSYIGYGYPYRTLHFRAWLDAGAFFVPQCYPNHDGYGVAACLAAADRAGIPRDIIAPAIGTWQGLYGYDITQYVTDLDAAGTLGFSAFRGDTMTDDDYRELGAAIVTRGIARPT